MRRDASDASDVIDAVGERGRGDDQVVSAASGGVPRSLGAGSSGGKSARPCAVGIVDEHLPDAGAFLLPADVFDAPRIERESVA